MIKRRCETMMIIFSILLRSFLAEQLDPQNDNRSNPQ